MPAIAVTVPPPARSLPPQRLFLQHRFTLDGDALLERHLSNVCADVLRGIQKIVPRQQLQALFLGGGYGRGEGGVLRTPEGDLPYNDLEFYVCLSGNRWLNRRRYDPLLHELAATLTPTALVEVEFHIISLTQLRRSVPNMFYYDLVSGHQQLWGHANLATECPQHTDAHRLPMAEATRLLMNRGTGLLLARARLAGEKFDADDCDFVARNIAKAQLALGDAVLTSLGEYHWSCRTRQQRLAALRPHAKLRGLGILPKLRDIHAAGVAFKLHPYRSVAEPIALRAQLQQTIEQFETVWLWLENRRLGQDFTSLTEYCESRVNKCPATNPLRNLLLNTRVFGGLSLRCSNAFRHPRERLFHALALLLENENPPRQKLNQLLGRRPRSQRSIMESYHEVWEMAR